MGTVVVTQDGDDLKVEMPLLDTMQIPYEPVLEPTLPNNFLRAGRAPEADDVDARFGSGQAVRRV